MSRALERLAAARLRAANGGRELSCAERFGRGPAPGSVPAAAPPADDVLRCDVCGTELGVGPVHAGGAFTVVERPCPNGCNRPPPVPPPPPTYYNPRTGRSVPARRR